AAAPRGARGAAPATRPEAQPVPCGGQTGASSEAPTRTRAGAPPGACGDEPGSRAEAAPRARAAASLRTLHLAEILAATEEEPPS
ncbi:hypothetical protein ACFWJF_20560, partial [Streptomyces yangpuensis]